MSAQKPEKIEKSEELIRAEQLSDDGKLDEALTLLIYYEQKEGLNHHDKASYHLLQCQILLWQGKQKELIKHAEQTYKESEGLENNFLKVDSLLLMTHALVKLGRLEEAFDLMKQGEELMKTLPQELSKAYKQREAYLAYIKHHFFNRKASPNDALKHLEHSLALREELGIKHEIAESLSSLAYHLCVFKGELNRPLKYAEQSLALAKESSKTYYIAQCLLYLGVIYSSRGELNRSIINYEQSLELYKELNNKGRMAAALNNVGDIYRKKGELDRALECLEQSLALYQELGNLINIPPIYDNLIKILIDKGDLERAQISLQYLERLNNQVKNKDINTLYLFDKALLLKTSLRAIKRVKAEEILKQLLEDKDIRHEFTTRALFSLCELLLTELCITNDLEVLDELNQFIARLLDDAEKWHSYTILCETYLIQAKLSLLTFNIKKAQRFLTQAHQIAERFGLNQLALKIASESEDLLTKLDLWKKLKESGAPMAERLELARLDEKIVRVVYNNIVLTSQLTEEKVAISKETKICLVCRGEVFGFSYICKCGANYCESCARAVTDLENVCWACDVPIDYSKPVKPYKEEEKAEIIEKKK